MLNTYPNAVVVSAHSGQGIDELRDRIDDLLPRPSHHITALIPFDRGELIARAHDEGTVESEKYTSQGTLLVAMVEPDLLHELEQFRQPDMVDPHIFG